jgi:hypothetical protein
MDVTLHLPDELVNQAEAQEVDLSQILRPALEDELKRLGTRKRVVGGEPQSFTLDLGGDDGVLTDLVMVEAKDGTEYYLTRDHRIIIVDQDPDRGHSYETVGPADEGVAALPPDAQRVLILDLFPHLDPGSLRPVAE